MSRKILMICVALFLLGAVSVAAQDNDDVCTPFIEDAIALASDACASTGRNQACYGNVLAAVESFPDGDPLTFETVGDVVNVADMQSLSLSPIDLDTDEWGVALMRLQANLPDTAPGQNVTILAFGDTAFRNAVEPVETAAATPEEDEDLVELSATVSSSQNINVRDAPNTSGTLVDVVGGGTEVTVDGRNAAGDWLRATLPDGRSGWIFATLLTVDGDINTLTQTDGLRVVTTLVPGQEVTGAITNADPFDSYTFQGQAGDVIQIRMVRASDNLDTYLNLYGPNGELIASNDDDFELGLSGSVIDNFELPFDGEYTVEATRFQQANGTSTGQYTLVVEGASSDFSAPMQAFYFRSGIGASSCSRVPESGVLVQTPQGVGEVRMLINEVRVDLGSTAFLQAVPGGDMVVSVIEGTGRVEAQGVARIIPAGTFVTIPLDDDLAASGIPSEVQPYDQVPLQLLPIGGLDEAITVAEPLPEEEIIAGEVTIQLTWDNASDMDVWLEEPDGTVVFFGNPGSISGAALDVDANAACSANFGTTEIISWPSGQPRLGVHEVQVREWDDCGTGANSANWELTVTIGDVVVISETGNGDASFEFER